MSAEIKERLANVKWFPILQIYKQIIAHNNNNHNSIHFW